MNLFTFRIDLAKVQIKSKAVRYDKCVHQFLEFFLLFYSSGCHSSVDLMTVCVIFVRDTFLNRCASAILISGDTVLGILVFFSGTSDLSDYIKIFVNILPKNRRFFLGLFDKNNKQSCFLGERNKINYSKTLCNSCYILFISQFSNNG